MMFVRSDPAASDRTRWRRLPCFQGRPVARVVLLSVLAAATPAAAELGATDRARLEEIRAGFTRNPGCRIADRLDLLRMLEREPAFPSLQETVEAVLVACEDFDGLVEIRLRKPEAERSPQERLDLVKLYARAARFEEGARIARPLADENPEDSEANWLAGYTTFHGGEPGQAVPYLERSVVGKSEEGVADPLVLLGLAALYDDRGEEATRLLERAVAVAPGSGGAWSALARARASSGDAVGAESAAQQARDIHTARRAQIKDRVWLNSRSHDASQALAERRFDAAAEILREMLPVAAPGERGRLLEALATAYDRSGRADLADAARAEAQADLSGGTP